MALVDGIDMSALGQTEVPLLKQILGALLGVPGGGAKRDVNGFAVPAFTGVYFDYYDTGATNIYHQYFKNGSTVVSTLTYAYIQDPVATANASIEAIVQS